MHDESGVIRSIIDELDSSVIKRNQTEGENGVTRSIIDEFNSSNMLADQMEVESGGS